MERRDFLKALAGLGGLLVARPSLASTLGGVAQSGGGAARRSKLPGSRKLFLVQTDLHNHSLISGDAFGDPHTALAAIRARGIDVACMTEHAIMGKGHGELTCPGWEEGGCQTVEGINDTDWEAMAGFADAANAPGRFVAFRGFEYSTPTVGHLNVWFTSKFTDPLQQRALITPRAISEVDQLIPETQPIVDVFEDVPDIATIQPFYDWLATSPDAAPFGGGDDGVACFNHPNDFGDFEQWVYHPGAAAHVTMFEAFNTNRYAHPDFFWYGAEDGKPNPFNACLNAGWRVGFTGVSDEHSTVYRAPGMARGGLWVASLTRDGVRAALKARRAYASLEPGLRIDATANGVPMGSTLRHASGLIKIALDIDRGAGWVGKRLWVEVIRPGAAGPTLLKRVPITVPPQNRPALSFTVNAARRDGDWMFLRITDPARRKHPQAKAPFERYGGATAYTSPWFLA